jgi:hypothetical protein
MSESTSNPFADIRVEATVGPRMLTRHAAVQSLEDARNSLLIGTRGSGKTSALLCLDWKERATNVSLMKELFDEPLQFVSVYSKLHDHISASIDVIPWETIVSDALKEKVSFDYFSTLIELLVAEQLVHSIMDMRGDAIIKYDFDGEQVTADTIYDIAKRCRFQLPRERFSDLAACSIWLSDYYIELHRLGSRHYLEKALEFLPASQPGRFLNQVVRVLHRLLTLPTSNNQLPEKFHFKICFDEAETLSLRQQVYLNTILRSSEAPLFWVIATVDRGFETTETLNRGQSITSTDRRVIYLDGPEAEEAFYGFAQRIVSLRIRNALGCFKTTQRTDYDDVEVDFRRLLDSFSVNIAIGRLIGPRKSKYSEKLRSWAEEFDSIVYGPKGRPRKGGAERRASYYQAFLLKKLFPNRRLSDVLPNDKTELANRLSNLRGKQYGALLCIVKEGHFGYVPYFGAESLLNLADGNIRELLEIVASLFEAAVTEYGEEAVPIFAGLNRSGRISWSNQRKAFEHASRSKLNGIANRHAEIGGSVTRLVYGLGQLTYLLQTDVGQLRALKSSAERGIFEIHLEEIIQPRNKPGISRESIIQRTREVLDRCIEDSLLKEATQGARKTAPAGEGRNHYQIRLHQRFAPYFKTSIRGAYVAQKLSANLLASLCVDALGSDTEQWAERAFEALNGDMPNSRQREFDWRELEED